MDYIFFSSISSKFFSRWEKFAWIRIEIFGRIRVQWIRIRNTVFFHAFSFYTIVWLFPIKRQATRMTQARKGRSLYLCNCISPKPLGSKSPSRLEIFLHKFISTYNCLCSKICFQWLTTWWSTHLKQSHCNVSLVLMKLFCQRGGHDPGQWEADPAGGGRSAQGWRRRGGPGTYTPPGGDHGHHQYMILKTSPQSCLQECIISQQEQL